MQLSSPRTLAALLSAALVVSVAGVELTNRLVVSAAAEPTNRSASAASDANWTYTTTKLPVTSDTFVSRESPQFSGDSRATLVVRNTPKSHKKAYLKFVVPQALLANHGQIESVVIRLASRGSSRSVVRVRATNKTSWSAAGMHFSNAPRVGARIATFVPGSGGFNRATVTSAVPAPGTYAFQLRTPAGVSRFYSSETTVKSKVPTLTVTVRRHKSRPRPPAPGPTTPAPGPTTPAPDPTTPAPTPTPTHTSGTCTPAFPGDRCGKPYFGASADSGDPASFETSIGSNMSLFRSYMVATTPASKFVTVANREIANGEIPVISTKVPGSWAQVASGAQDAWLLERIKALAAVPGPVWLCLHHEPTGDGAPADWVAMQQHARKLIDANSTNIALVGILNGWDFIEANPHPEVWNMPVGTGVDIMGFDNYNPWSPTNGKKWLPASTVLSPAVTIASWGYPTMVGEYGVRNDPANPGKAAQWMADAYKYAVDHKIAGMAYFNSGLNSPDGTWALDGERLTQFKASLASSKTP
jgi:hypothetical protein